MRLELRLRVEDEDERRRTREENKKKMVLTIYAPLFASAKRGVVTLIEKGVEFETVNVDLLKGEQRQPEYLAIQVSSSSPILFFF